MESKVLGGFCRYSPAEVVELWVKSPWETPKKGRWERDTMFSMEKDFRKVKPAQPGITSLIHHDCCVFVFVAHPDPLPRLGGRRGGLPL
jgi:hypothetical protein